MTRICHRDFAPIIVGEADENGCKVPSEPMLIFFRSHLKDTRSIVSK